MTSDANSNWEVGASKTHPAASNQTEPSDDVLWASNYHIYWHKTLTKEERMMAKLRNWNYSPLPEPGTLIKGLVCPND